MKNHTITVVQDEFSGRQTPRRVTVRGASQRDAIVAYFRARARRAGMSGSVVYGGRQNVGFSIESPRIRVSTGSHGYVLDSDGVVFKAY